MKNHNPINALETTNVGSVILSSREKIHVRALELAEIAGRGSDEITQFDYEQAKRDVTGEVDRDRQNAVLTAGHTPAAKMQASTIRMSINHSH